MLLPSVLPCDSAHSAPLTRCQSSRFASPPLSPPSSSSAPLGTCRALQYLLMPSTPLPNTQQLPPSPPTTQMASPFKLRLRTRKSADSDAATFTPRKKITKRAAPARGASKRRRDVDDDMIRDEVDSENDEVSSHEDNAAPSTPKRLRFAPPVLPLGLERSDFHNLDLDLDKDNQIESVVDEDGQEVWSTEDDRMLVELVLEKLRLSKSDLQDCARSLGKDKESVGRRWKSLMGNGEVGLKRQRRTKLHGTWR